MRYIKTFEDIDEKPKIGDYVLMRSECGNEETEKFINNTIGEIYHFDFAGAVIVRYENPPNDFDKARMFHKSQIVAFAPTIKELELKLQTMKYNL